MRQASMQMDKHDNDRAGEATGSAQINMTTDVRSEILTMRDLL